MKFEFDGQDDYVGVNVNENDHIAPREVRVRIFNRAANPAEVRRMYELDLRGEFDPLTDEIAGDSFVCEMAFDVVDWKVKPKPKYVLEKKKDVIWWTGGTGYE